MSFFLLWAKRGGAGVAPVQKTPVETAPRCAKGCNQQHAEEALFGLFCTATIAMISAAPKPGITRVLVIHRQGMRC